MGIRFEKDTILNWVNDMAKYLRLVVEHYEHFDKEKKSLDIDKGYSEYFKRERLFFKDADEAQIEGFLSSLEAEQIRPLAQLLMYDGLLSNDKEFLSKAKFIFELNMKKTGAFSFEDFEYLSVIDKNI